MRSLSLWCLIGAGALAGCTFDGNDGASSGALTDPPSTQLQCIEAVVTACYAEQLSPADCAALIEARCLADDPPPPTCDPGDPRGCPPPPDDCRQRVLAECMAAGIDEMTCALRIEAVCQPPPPPPCEPRPDGSCEPPPPDDCFDRIFRECVAAGLDEMACAQRASEACEGTEPPRPCDPMDPGCEPPPPPPDDCFQRVLAECLATGLDEETCARRAGEACVPDDPPWPCDPMDPGCEPPPPPPEDCFGRVLRECVAAGIDEMTCFQRAAEACPPEPPPPPPRPCDPMDPNCCHAPSP